MCGSTKTHGENTFLANKLTSLFKITNECSTNEKTDKMMKNLRAEA